MRRILPIVFLLVLGGVMTTGSAEAQTACFSWFCFTSSGQCAFNASCSAGPGETPVVFEWTWGDGSPTQQTFDEQIGHTYAAPQAFATVNLNVGYLFIGYDDVTCQIHIRNVISPVEPYFFGTCS